MTLSGARQAPAVQADEGTSSRSRLLVVLAILTFGASIALVMQWFTAWSFVTWEASDLSVYRQAGEVIASGQPLYDVRFEPGFWTYPPFGGLVMVPLTLVPLDVLFPLAYVVNTLGLALVIVLTGRPLLRRAPDAAGRVLMVVGLTFLGLTITPIAEVLALGQIGVLLMVACCLDVLVVGRRLPRAQGVLVGIGTAIKLTPASSSCTGSSPVSTARRSPPSRPPRAAGCSPPWSCARTPRRTSNGSCCSARTTRSAGTATRS